MIKNPYENKDQIAKGELYREVFDSLNIANKTLDEFNNDFRNKYKGETEIVDLSIKFGEDNKQDFLDYGDIYAGKNPNPIYNYTPTRTEAILGKDKDADPSKFDMLKNMMSDNTVGVSESKSLLSRVNLDKTEINRAFNFDFDNVVDRAYREQLMNVYLSKQAQATSRVLDSAKLNAMLGKENVDILRRALNAKIATDLNRNITDSPNIDKAVRFLDTIVGKQAQYILGNIGQFLKQSTVLADTAIVFNKTFGNIVKATKAGTEIPPGMKALIDQSPIGRRIEDRVYKGRIDAD
jgi:hypothetical protein